MFRSVCTLIGVKVDRLPRKVCFNWNYTGSNSCLKSSGSRLPAPWELSVRSGLPTQRGGKASLPTRMKSFPSALHRPNLTPSIFFFIQQFSPYKLFLHVLFKSENMFSFTLVMGTVLSLNPLKVRILWIKYNSICIRSNFSHKPQATNPEEQ